MHGSSSSCSFRRTRTTEGPSSQLFTAAVQPTSTSKTDSQPSSLPIDLVGLETDLTSRHPPLETHPSSRKASARSFPLSRSSGPHLLMYLEPLNAVGFRDQLTSLIHGFNKDFVFSETFISLAYIPTPFTRSSTKPSIQPSATIPSLLSTTPATPANHITGIVSIASLSLPSYHFPHLVLLRYRLRVRGLLAPRPDRFLPASSLTSRLSMTQRQTG
jgi:hypothetical protein